MSRQVLACALAIISFSILGQHRAAAGDPDGGPLKFRMGSDGIRWEDYHGEAAYRVYGYVLFLPPPSCGPNRLFSSERVEFDQELPANTTHFQPSPPKDERLTWGKDGSVTVEALDANGEVLVRDGSAWQADKFCTPEEIAAAGSGPPVGGSLVWPLAAALLATTGAALVASGLTLRKDA